MNKLYAGLLAAASVAGTLASTPAWAQRSGRHHFHHHARVGVYVGAPLLWSPFWYPYPYPYYYPPAVVLRPSAPVVYVEQADAIAGGAPAAPQAQAQPQQQYWHYCADSNTYYPYVSTCASPWQTVVPYPPAPQ